MTKKIFARVRWEVAGILGIWIMLSTLHTASAGETLAAIKSQGFFRCGVMRQVSIAMSDMNAQGEWQGFFPDFCRALAVAVTGSEKGVEFVELGGMVRFKALAAKEVDILIANTTMTLTRETEMGFDFPAIYYYDGQGFMAHADLNVKTLKELQQLKSCKVCVLENTTSVDNLSALIKRTHPNLEPVFFKTHEGYFDAFFSRQCDVITNDRLALSLRASQADTGTVVIFPDVISKEPLAPAIREDDPAWANIVRWTVYALITAEELGVTQTNLEEQRKSADPNIQRLLGITPGIGKALGLDDAWIARVIAAVGNYGEIFERHLGGGSAYKIERGLNALWSQGGLMYAPPLR
jgi:general L-amino acid transport system substrate-binding protein